MSITRKRGVIRKTRVERGMYFSNMFQRREYEENEEDQENEKQEKRRI